MDMSSKLTNGLPHPHIMYDRTDYREYFQGGREELLRRAFADEADVEQVNVEEQLSGYSGAQTWRVSTNTGQIFIVKIAHPTIIAQENENYRRYVRGKLSNAAHALDKPFEATSGEWALLKYADVGEQSRTLLAFLEDNGSVDIAVILSDIFRVQGKWWAKDEPKLIRNCGYYYDRLLPEHFRLHELQIASDAPGIITPNLILKAGVVDQGSVAKLEATIEKSKRASLVIKLENFRVDKVKGDVMSLSAQPPADVPSPSIRVKLSNAKKYEPGTIVSLYAINLKTRLELLHDYVKEVIEGLADNSNTFVVEQIRYVNPIRFLHELLAERYKTRISTIHGDLNLQNILVESNENDRRYKYYWLIDFAETGEGPTLLDLQWLETQVITWLLAPALGSAEQMGSKLIEIFKALHDFKELPPELRESLQSHYNVLLEIRRLVGKSYLAVPNQWEEYYRGLVIALVGSIRFEQVDKLGKSARLAAFLSAAILIPRTRVLPSSLDNLPVPVFQPPLPPIEDKRAEGKIPPITIGPLPDSSTSDGLSKPEGVPPKSIETVTTTPQRASVSKILGMGGSLFFLLLIVAAGTWFIPPVQSPHWLNSAWGQVCNYIPVLRQYIDFGDTPESTRAGLTRWGKIIVAASIESAPFSYINEKDHFDGLDVNIVREIVRGLYGLGPNADPEAMGYLEFEGIQSVDREGTLENDPDIAFLIGAFSTTPERCGPNENGPVKFLCTDRSYFRTQKGLLVQISSPVKNYCDLKLKERQAKIIVLGNSSTGATYSAYEEECGFTANIEPGNIPVRKEAFNQVVDNPSLVYQADKPILDFYLRCEAYNPTQSLHVISPTDPGLGLENYVIGIAKDKENLHKIVNDSLDKLLDGKTLTENGKTFTTIRQDSLEKSNLDDCPIKK